MAKRYYFTKWQGVLDECLFTFLSAVWPRSDELTLQSDRESWTSVCLPFCAAVWPWSGERVRGHSWPLEPLCTTSQLPPFVQPSCIPHLQKKSMNADCLSSQISYIYMEQGQSQIYNIHIYIPSLTKLLQEKNAVILQI